MLVAGGRGSKGSQPVASSKTPTLPEPLELPTVTG
jgi:hypothetical protein